MWCIKKKLLKSMDMFDGTLEQQIKEREMFSGKLKQIRGFLHYK